MSQTTQSGSTSKGGTSSSKPSSKNLVLSDENLTGLLVASLFKHVSRETLAKFIRTYLLEAAQQSVRWSLHALLYSVYKSSTSTNQDLLFDILMQMWPHAVIAFGAKAAQYVDLLGYIVIKSSASQSQVEPVVFKLSNN